MQCLFLGMCMPDAHLLHGDHPGILIGQDISIVGQGAHACLEAMATVRLCLSMWYASITAGEESNSIIGWEAKVQDRTEISCSNVLRLGASVKCSGIRSSQGSRAGTGTLVFPST
jgi:hypothetical protein